MKLKPEEIKAILAGHHPEIVRKGACPFEKGEVVTLKTLQSRSGPVPQVSITILNLKRGKKGEWMPEYSVRDDRELYLAKGSGYTRSISQTIDDEAPVIDPVAIESYAKENWTKTRLLRAERTGTGKLAKEYAARQAKRLEAA